MADVNESVAAEKKSILSLTDEIVASVARLHPSKTPPKLEQLEVPTEEAYAVKSLGHNYSLLLVFTDKTQWVIKFPLFSRTAKGLIARKIHSEVATTNWVKANTGIPVPSIHDFDPDGTAEWNSTRRPCIVMNKAQGRPMTDTQWRELKGEKQQRVITQIAQVTAELASHRFQKIGSLFRSQAGPIVVGPLVLEALNRYMYGFDHLHLFFAPKSPYESVMDYFLDLANLFLVHQVFLSPVMTEGFVKMWICRSLIPASVVDDYNRGPFVLRHGNMERRYVFFDQNLKLTSIINWEWTHTVPVQTAALPPAFISFPPGKIDSKQRHMWYLSTCKLYDAQIAKFESDYWKNRGGALHLTELVKIASNLLSMEGVLTGGSLNLESTFVLDIFRPIFGQIDIVSFTKVYKEAPGVKEEFRRIQQYLLSEYEKRYAKCYELS
jgi:hypothetical protein